MPKRIRFNPRHPWGRYGDENQRRRRYDQPQDDRPAAAHHDQRATRMPEVKRANTRLPARARQNGHLQQTIFIAAGFVRR